MFRTDELMSFMESTGGVATSTSILNAGFSAGLIAHLLKQGGIEKETRGVYVLPHVLLDDFAALSLRWRQCTFSHGSALYLLGFSDRMPTHLEVTIPRTYNAKNLKTENPRIQLYRAEGALFDLGRTELLSPSGILVPGYDSERCLCDLIKARETSHVDVQLLNSSLNGYFNREDKDIAKLNRYAKALGVETELHRYTEVLL